MSVGVANVEPMLVAREVAVEIAGNRILADADLTLEAGRLVAIVGPNGAGKSTLVRAVAGLQRMSGGRVTYVGEELGSLRGRRLARLRAFVPQRPRVPEGVTVHEAVRIGRSPQLRALGRPTRADRDAVERAMERTAVREFAGRRLTTLSGGELQRVQIAVGLAQGAPLLIADEPTSHLDLGAAVAVARLMRGLADEGLAVCLVVHDLSLAAAVADTVVVISEGRSVAAGPAEEVLAAERLAGVWGVEAELDLVPGGRTALRVAWLDRPDHPNHPEGEPR